MSPDLRVCAVFEDEAAILAATRSVRAAGWEIEDAFAPYAVHGLDEAMGVRRTRLGVVCFVCGLAGALAMLWFQYWTAMIDWPLNVGGKPLDSWPAFVPITFEAAVLLAALGSVLALFVRCGLRPGARREPPRPRALDDRFVLVVRLGAHDPAALHRLLDAAGAVEIEDPMRPGRPA